MHDREILAAQDNVRLFVAVPICFIVILAWIGAYNPSHERIC